MRDRLGRFVKGHPVTEDMLRKIKIARQKQIIVITPETRKKMIEGRRGYRHSLETRRKIGLATLGRKYSKEINKKKGSPREKNPNWKGGIRKSKRGYIYILMPDHPRADNRGCVKRANLVKISDN